MNQERLAPFVQMFNEYDVIIFNHRGVPFNKGVGPLEGVSGREMTFGKREEHDLLAVIFDLFKQKNYAKIYGLGLCYSAPILMKASVVRPGVFDKLILDGAWVSAKDTIDRLGKYLLLQAKDKWWGRLFPLDAYWFKGLLTWLGKVISGVNPKNIDFNFVPYIQQFHTPVLFIHGQRDPIVPNSEFMFLWNQVPSKEKSVLLTSGGHVSNHLKFKEVYKEICERFFELPFDEFVGA